MPEYHSYDYGNHTVTRRVLTSDDVSNAVGGAVGSAMGTTVGWLVKAGRNAKDRNTVKSVERAMQEEENGEGGRWIQVRTSDGTNGWVPERYVTRV